jgi:hypothetical protein
VEPAEEVRVAPSQQCPCQCRCCALAPSATLSSFFTHFARDPWPGHELLVGGSRDPAGLDPVDAALFWLNSEVSRAEAAVLAATHYVTLIHSTYLESLESHFTTPPNEGSPSKRVKVSPSSSERQADPMDEDDEAVEEVYTAGDMD